MPVRQSHFPLLPTLLAFVCLALSIADPASADYRNHPDAKTFAARMAKQHGFDPDQVLTLLGKAERRDDILKLMRRPAEGKPWHEYRRIFMTERRIEEGVRFWNEHEADLERLSAKYKVNPEIIVAILGVETFYGARTGNHRVLDALATLSFDYPPRARFFGKELEHFLLLAREENTIRPDRMKGSYAGAMGWGQFIPSSYRAYAVDGDGDGQRDLWGSTADVIASVANYFARHGWRPGETVTEPVQVAGDYGKALTKGRKPQLTLAQLEQRSVQIPADAPPDRKAKLLELEQPGGAKTFWLGYHNFYVITRYNLSHKYAMAVHQLSREILARR